LGRDVGVGRAFLGVIIEAVPRPYVSNSQLIGAGVVGAIVGALVGTLAGLIQWKTRSRELESANSRLQT
jgi:hypothetical protein